MTTKADTEKLVQEVERVKENIGARITLTESALHVKVGALGKSVEEDIANLHKKVNEDIDGLVVFLGRNT